MIPSRRRRLTALLPLAAVLALAVGCEGSSTSATVIVLTPSSATLVKGEGSVLFTAGVSTNSPAPLYLPLEWTVDNPELGTIQESAGVTAVYTGIPGAIGSNTVTVRDRANAEGLALVSQPATAPAPAE